MKSCINRKKFFVLSVCMAVLSITTQVANCETYGGGSGTAEAPYLIYTAEQMNAIGANPGDWGKHFKLMADIDLSEYTGTEFNIIGRDENDPIQGLNPFTGVFDGNGKTISNFTYSCSGKYVIGLFGVVGQFRTGEAGEIMNLGLINPQIDVAGTCYYIGALVAKVQKGSISNCYVEGGTVSGHDNVGGLIGDFFDDEGAILNCYTSCDVLGRHAAIGGLAGNNFGTITNCYASGNVTGEFLLGGLVAGNHSDSFGHYGVIANCYATGSVEGISGNIGNIGGLVAKNGWGEATITNCYSIGSVSGSGSYVGGLVGISLGGPVIDSFWDKQTSGQTTSAGGIGKTTAQMQMESTFTSAGWDFATPIWRMCDGPPDYPRLWWERCPGPQTLQVPDEYDTIQAAIDASIDGDIVLVADGIYTGPGNRDLDFGNGLPFGQTRAITVRSENGPANCIIDCQGLGRAFIFDNFEDSNSVVEGFTIQNGSASYGGGIECYFASPKISSCIIRGNSGGWGGGIDSYNSNPTITNCTITGNTAVEYGGGISCYDSSPEITRCTIVGNSAGLGGGIHCETSSPTINDCTISDNSAIDGGAIYSFYSSSLTITNCTISGNSAYNGGGIYMRGGNPIVSSCIISGNISHKTGIGPHGEGGGIFCWESAPTIINCTITGNAASKGGGLNGCYGPISNCIIWDNSADNGPQLYHSPDVTYSCIQNHTTGGQGNIDADPCFVESGYWLDANDPNIIVEPNDPNAVWIEGNYHLLEGSPCINAGDPNYPYDPNETDIDGLPRVIGGRIDMGAYEFNHIPVSDAGEDREIYAWIDGMAEVLLDGSGCYDEDGQPLSYIWSWTIDGETYTAEGVSPTIELPVGEHTIELIVKDGIDDSEPDEVVIIVVPPMEIPMKFTPQALNPGSQGRWVKVHFVLPEGFGIEDVDVNTPTKVWPFGIESNYINIFINEDSLVELEIGFDRADFCGAGINYGPAEIMVVGLLTSGRYFYGSDTIRIITSNLKYLAVLASHWLEGGCVVPDWCSGVDLDQNSVVDFVDFALFNGCCIEVIKE